MILPALHSADTVDSADSQSCPAQTEHNLQCWTEHIFVCCALLGASQACKTDTPVIG